LAEQYDRAWDDTYKEFMKIIEETKKDAKAWYHKGMLAERRQEAESTDSLIGPPVDPFSITKPTDTAHPFFI
jgi:hypothetical protein